MDCANPRNVAIVVLIALGVTGCSGSDGDRGDPVVSAKAPEFRNMTADVAYVGQRACRQCHLEKFGTYRETGMGRALYPMTASEVVEDFTIDNVITTGPAGLSYRMLERDGKYYQQQFIADSSGREIVKAEHELVYALGSNNHARSYITLVDDKLFQAPICWYPQGELWDLCPGFEVANEHFHRELGLDCLHCHNGVMTPVENERNQYETIPHGIGCERCHGPAELHVERWASGSESAHGDLDPTIVNPRRLPRDERIEVCFQCHLGDARATENVIREGREARGFRPGMKITEVVMPYRYAEQTRYDFGLSAQADRLMLSRCFDEGGIECLTCHNPHVTVYHEDRPDDFFRMKCLTCHEQEACSAPDADRQATTPADDCIACHMRKAEPDDQRHTEFTDHWIRREARIVEPDHRGSYALEPVFPDRAAELPVGERAYYRARAGFLLARDAPESRRAEVWGAAEDDFLEAIDAGFDNVGSWFFLGKLRTDMGKSKLALEAYEKAVAHDATHHDAVFALGQALLAAGDGRRALTLFERLLAVDPDDPMALAETARIYVALGRIPEALEAYEHAIREEPWTASLHMNAGMLLASQSRFDEAALRGETAARLDPGSPSVWEFYSKIMQAAGKPEKAAAGRRVLDQLLKDQPGG